uniref:Chemokine interleukin-8-like domain-containing protein n=1 Tax=Neolamprologus brichardi TaxID=32507 RepID=A0A3Q4MHJ4_NEOBR
MRTAGVLFVVGLCLLDVTSSFKICAFNIQSFGESKANNKKVMGILLKRHLFLRSRTKIWTLRI